MKKNITLLSDQIVHWNIVPTVSGKNVYMETWGKDSTERILETVLAYFKQSDPDIEWSLTGPGLPVRSKKDINPTNNALNHAFATWKQFKNGKQKAWKIEDIVHVGQSKPMQFDPTLVEDLQNADVVLCQDWGMDIRNQILPKLPVVLKDKWIIHRCYPPLFEGVLWDQVQQSNGKKKVLLMRASDLRQMNTSISKGASWEQTIQDMLNEIYFKKNIALYPLRTMEHIFISFGCTGTLYIHNPMHDPSADPDIHLFFDAMGVEGYWEEAHPGYLPGDLELLAVLLLKEILAGNAAAPNFTNAIRAHLLARRELLTQGADIEKGSLAFECIPPQLDKIYGAGKSNEFMPVKLNFSMFRSILEENNNASSSPKEWTLLGLTKWDLYSLARRIAIHGPKKALAGWNIPIARYNFLLTIDRKEIEFLHNLKSLISEYMFNRSSQPLSIAVFGAPGSGKSFSIKQLAKTLNIPGQDIQSITFNLSQFNEDEPNDLYQAFHAVRDISLAGKIPLVFWDEFDSKNLAWLRYFLAPMQDGEFQEGQLTHNIGKSIFVFAGGTCTCMQQFEEKTRNAITEKGPDFLSRLKGFINVMGPNPVLSYKREKDAKLTTKDEHALLDMARKSDPEYIIRRAILINSLLNIHYPQLFNDGELQIDDGILHALLMTPKFKHGTRSMETIFKTSRLFGKQKYHRSDLPPESQLNLHVNGKQFYELLTQQVKACDGGDAFYHLVNEITLDESLIDRMAVGIHTIYSLVFSSGKESDPLSITKAEFQKAYEKMQSLPDEIPPDEVSQNYHNARKIPEKLAVIDFHIIPLHSTQQADTFTDEEFEKVSRLEHIRWVQHHIQAGWAFSPKKDKPKRLHNALVAWDEEERKNAAAIYGKTCSEKMGLEEGQTLSEYYRNLDRIITLAIPWILEDVGYKMVRAA